MILYICCLHSGLTLYNRLSYIKEFIKMSIKFVSIDHQELVEQMASKGLYLFSYVSIDTTELKYRSDIEYARHSSLFFWYPQTQIIFMVCCLEEKRGDNDLRMYWSVEVFMGFHESLDHLISLTENKTVDEIPNISGANSDRYGPEGFSINGHSYSGSDKQVSARFSFDGSMSELSTGCYDIVGVTKRFLKKLSFEKLWVWSFPPTYYFEECEMLFWSRFDKRQLRSLVLKPYGSKFLER